MKRTTIVLVAILSLVLLVSVVGCSSTTESTEPAAESEEPAAEEPGAEEPTTEEAADPSEALVESKCSLCHTTERVWSADYDRATWETTVDRMKANGLVITDEEYEEIVTYLSE